MKYIVQLCRLLVGVLFIISGLIKLNDPLGFSYKLQEYFSTDVLNIPFLEPYALGISVIVVVFEVVLGVFLLIGYKPKFTVWSLLGMIVFFTFLTFYSAYFDKVKDCGCFGDAIKLTPWESFTKDVILLVLILVLFFGLKHIKPLFAKLPTTVLALLSFVISLWFGYHVLMHLPSVDFRAYKLGANIQEGMVVPEDAPKPVQEFTWTFNVDGKEEQFVTNGSYPDVKGDYVGYEIKVIDEGYTPPIQDFSIESDEEDLTERFLNEEHLIMVVMYDMETAEKEGVEKLKAITDEALRKGYKVIGLSASGSDVKQRFKEAYKFNFDTYLCDEKALKTVVRSNPGVLEMKRGTVTQKLHWNDLEALQLESLPNAKPDFNFELKNELDQIYKLDQGVRNIYFAENKADKDALATSLGLPVQDNVIGYMKVWNEVDSLNLMKVEKIIKEHGYPGKALVGDKSNEVAWFVIQHASADKIAEYIELLRDATKKGDIPKSLMALMEDRHLMYQEKEQIYGTQGSTDGDVSYIWPIKDPENVNQRRKDIGLKESVEAYAKRLFGEAFVYKPITLEQVKKIRATKN